MSVFFWHHDKFKIFKKQYIKSHHNKFIILRYNNDTNSFIINNYNSSKINYNDGFVSTIHDKIETIVQHFILAFFYYTSKITFKSKCFRVKYYKRKKTLKFLFGKSHKEWMVMKNIFIKKRKKYKYVTAHYNKQKLYNFCRNFANVRRWSWYTGRCLRIGQQVVKRKKGKTKNY